MPDREGNCGITPEMKLAARAFGISGRAVERAGKLRKRGAPEINEAVEAGVLSLNEALTITGLKTMQWFNEKENADDRT